MSSPRRFHSRSGFLYQRIESERHMFLIRPQRTCDAVGALKEQSVSAELVKIRTEKAILQQQEVSSRDLERF